MAISTWNAAWIARRVRRDLVSIERARTRPERKSNGSTYCLARVAHRLHRHILLGALRRARETSFRPTGRDSQFRRDQFDYLRAFIPADLALRQNRRPASRRCTCKSHSHYLLHHLHHHDERFVLFYYLESQRRALENIPTTLHA